MATLTGTFGQAGQLYTWTAYPPQRVYWTDNTTVDFGEPFLGTASPQRDPNEALSFRDYMKKKGKVG